jgi:putative N6-adenine-specific DNA methylase
MKLNLNLYTAHHVLYRVLETSCRNPDELYKAVYALAWENLLPHDTTLCITSSVKTPSINDTRFANLKCKDAIVDKLAAKTGKRCNSGPERDGIVVHLYWQDDRCMLYIDTSGDSLSRRGYRKIPGDAPMQETLAAGVIRATGWSGTKPFVNPMCGSGTLAIEAALLSMKRKAGTLRNNFCFMHLLPFDPEKLIAMRDDLKNSELASPQAAIVANDISEQSLWAAKENSRVAGVEQFIDFSQCDVSLSPVPENGKGIVLINPEYGIRMGNVLELESVYKKIGDFFKQRCKGYRGFIFTGNLDLMKKVGLKSSKRTPFMSGKLECRLYEYELYDGRK